MIFAKPLIKTIFLNKGCISSYICGYLQTQSSKEYLHGIVLYLYDTDQCIILRDNLHYIRHLLFYESSTDYPMAIITHILDPAEQEGWTLG